MTYNFPLTITEVPHLLPRKTWTIENADHLARCIAAADRVGYTDWHVEQGNIIFKEDDDGELVEVENETQGLVAYLDWLRHDLAQLIIHGDE